ncbi:hypothetical protein HT031_003995 [Scenedesmus sp. PABB004]|nr:hypothetical protein HT031_003995 [Scenedesmus sp. PABB004]
MTEYWKSHAMHWCELCRCWMNDTNAAKLNHERGAKHQENLQRKIRAMSKRADADKKEADAAAEAFEGIEAAAAKQYAADQAAAAAAAGSWEWNAGSQLYYNAKHRWYYDTKTAYYYGGEPVAWTQSPAGLPSAAMWGVAPHSGGPAPPWAPPPAGGAAAGGGGASAAAAVAGGGGGGGAAARVVKKVVALPAHPQSAVGGHQMPVAGRIGGAKGVGAADAGAAAAAAKRKRDDAPAGKGRKPVDPAEAEAQARREAARARVEARTKAAFGLTMRTNLVVAASLLLALALAGITAAPDGAPEPDVLRARAARSSAGAAAPPPTRAAAAVGVASAPAAGAAAANPLLDGQRQFLPWDAIRAEHVEPALRQVIAEETASLELLEADLAGALSAGGGGLTFERVMAPLTQIRLRYDAVSGAVSHLSGVMSSDALRAAVEAVTPLQVEFDLRLGQSAPVFAALAALQRAPGLAADEARLVARTLQEMRNAGVGLAGEERDTFNGLSGQLQALQNTFNNNVLDAKAAFQLLVTDPARLAGLPAATRDAAAAAAAAAGHGGVGGGGGGAAGAAGAGPWLLSLDPSIYTSVMTSATDRSLREALFKADKTTAASGRFDNTATIDEILSLRRRLAGLLGYDSWGDFKATTRMASMAEATNLMEQMVVAARPAAEREHEASAQRAAAAAATAELVAFARNASGDPGLSLEWWDVPFWAERQSEARFNLRQEDLQTYLGQDSVLAGLFDLIARTYGVVISRLDPQPPVWHPDVVAYGVADASAPGDPIAYLYADLYARPGQKGSGAWEQGLLPRARFWRGPSPAAAAAAAAAAGAGAAAAAGAPLAPGLARAQADWLASAPGWLPSVAIVCNQAPPAGGRPSLLTLRDVETLFHEAGHALQDMLTTARLGLTAGIRNIELDAVELPSMAQEKFVFDATTFAGLARHVDSGAPPPDGTFDQVAALQRYRKGTLFASQMARVLTDLRLHTTYEPGAPGGPTPAEVYLQTFSQTVPLAPWSGDRWLNQFKHLFYFGYEAGYYSYYWADVMSADIHGAFAAAARDPAALAALGRRYRGTVLSLGGSVAPGEVFARLMGRPPSIAAWLALNGLGA